MDTLHITDELVKLGEGIIQAEPRFSVVKNQEDDSEVVALDAATFLKFEGKRIGRDFELYNMMSAPSLDGVANTIIRIVTEILFPIQHLSPVAFQVAITQIKTLKVFGDKQAKWERTLDQLAGNE